MGVRPALMDRPTPAPHPNRGGTEQFAPIEYAVLPVLRLALRGNGSSRRGCLVQVKVAPSRSSWRMMWRRPDLELLTE